MLTITWPIALVLLGVIAAFCFALWVRFRREMEKEHHIFQGRAFTLEEKKFEVWKTANLAHTAQQGGAAKRLVDQAMRSGLGMGMATAGTVASEVEPDGGKVVSMFDRRKPGKPVEMGIVGIGGIGTARLSNDEQPSEERMSEIATLLIAAKDMPPDERREFLRAHGLEDVTYEDEKPSGP